MIIKGKILALFEWVTGFPDITRLDNVDLDGNKVDNLKTIDFVTST